MLDTQLLRLCLELARAAGDHAARCRRAGLGTPDHKSSATDVVTACDRSTESLIVERLREERPDDGLRGEEGTDTVGTSGFVWHIDPIDGTTNFVYGNPNWCTSIGVADADGTVAGAVYLPESGELFSAARGAGATLNGIAISVSGATELSQSLVGTGFGYRAEHRQMQSTRLAAMITEFRDIRRSGSAAIDLCAVACGRLDAYFEDFLHPWDIAAGELIAREAGAQSCNFSGGPAHPEDIVVASPAVLEPLRVLIASTVIPRSAP